MGSKPKKGSKTTGGRDFFFNVSKYCERGLRLHHVFFLDKSDGGPEKGPLMLDISISL